MKRTALVVLLLLTLAACRGPETIEGNSLVGGEDGTSMMGGAVESSIWVFYAECDKKHDGGFYGWKSAMFHDRKEATQAAADHKNEWGHNARVRKENTR